MCCALFTRYNRYIVVTQQLNPLQISYRPVTPVTSLPINNLASVRHQPSTGTLQTLDFGPCTPHSAFRIPHSIALRSKNRLHGYIVVHQ
jgi:hypothetical protein